MHDRHALGYNPGNLRHSITTTAQEFVPGRDMKQAEGGSIRYHGVTDGALKEEKDSWAGYDECCRRLGTIMDTVIGKTVP